MLKTYEEFKEEIIDSIISDTEAALLYLKENFPKNEIRFPPTFFRHQVYALLKNKTKTDREVNALQMTGKLIIYKLGGDKDNIAEIVVFTEDVKNHILRHTNSNVVKNFLDIMPLIQNVFVDLNCLTSKFSMTSGNVRELVQESVLVMRDIGSYWLSFPRVGEFVKSYSSGRKEVLQMIKKSKYSEILESDFRKRKLSKKATLGMAYHMYDIIGSEAVKYDERTTSSFIASWYCLKDDHPMEK